MERDLSSMLTLVVIVAALVVVVVAVVVVIVVVVVVIVFSAIFVWRSLAENDFVETIFSTERGCKLLLIK